MDFCMYSLYLLTFNLQVIFSKLLDVRFNVSIILIYDIYGQVKTRIYLIGYGAKMLKNSF